MPDILETKQGIATLSKFLERIDVFIKNVTDLPRWKLPVMERFGHQHFFFLLSIFLDFIFLFF